MTEDEWDRDKMAKKERRMQTHNALSLDRAHRYCEIVMSTGSMVYANNMMAHAIFNLEDAIRLFPKHKDRLADLISKLDAGWDRIGWPPDDLMQEVMGGIADLRAELTGPRLA